MQIHLSLDGAGGLGQLIDVSIHEAVSSTVEGAFPNWEYMGELSIGDPP